jgi:L-seryl-tRNA(Ser) seleniumtransferase
MDKQALLSKLPAVDELLKSEVGQQWQRKYLRHHVVRAIRQVLDERRETILGGAIEEVDEQGIVTRIGALAEELSGFSLKPCLNATGVVLHTNLGRSILSREVLDHVAEIAGNYSNLEYDIDLGVRGKRYSHIRGLLRELTGAEDGIVVNNNAAAVLVTLSSLAKGSEVIVSRGELVEIGGSFRVPDVMAASGAILREVGTTNKTHGFDYERAITENTALLMKVHQSNFRMLGFTSEVSTEELASIGRKFNVPVMFDLGSGCFIDMKAYGIHIEPTVQEIIAAGADVVTFSGDKLLGGPQAGIIVGKSQHIEKIEKNPLMRAVRIDKMTLAAFEATLMNYIDEDTAREKTPTLSMLLERPEQIKIRAGKVASLLAKGAQGVTAESAKIDVVRDVSQSGGGALAGVTFDTYAIAVSPMKISVNDLERRLRLGSPPVIARIKDDRLVLDIRTIRNEEVGALVRAVKAALA